MCDAHIRLYPIPDAFLRASVCSIGKIYGGMFQLRKEMCGNALELSQCNWSNYWWIIY